MARGVVVIPFSVCVDVHAHMCSSRVQTNCGQCGLIFSCLNFLVQV